MTDKTRPSHANVPAASAAGGERDAASGGSRPPAIRVASPRDLLAVVPYLLGFHPQRSLVVVGVRPPRDRVHVCFRYDLPDPPDPAYAHDIAAHAVAVLTRQHVTGAVVAGYGPGHLVTPVAEQLRDQFTSAGTDLHEMLRADGGRYWSYLCQNPACCPAEGVPYDVATSAASAAAVAQGMPVLPSRDELAATIAPATGPSSDAMREATTAARTWADELTRDPVGARTRVSAEGCALARAAVATYRGGGRLADQDAARLTALLSDLRVRDEAWALIDPADVDPHLALWSDMTRRAQTNIAACASLLAFAAWANGDGALANIALTRALDADPGYPMAHLIGEALQAAMPPPAKPVMTPDELAAAHGEQPTPST